MMTSKTKSEGLLPQDDVNTFARQNMQKKIMSDLTL